MFKLFNKKSEHSRTPRFSMHYDYILRKLLFCCSNLQIHFLKIKSYFFKINVNNIDIKLILMSLTINEKYIYLMLHFSLQFLYLCLTL